MNPEPTPTPREQIEMRLTALLMGELSAEETVALHAQIAADPGLARLHARLRQAMELLREATAEPEPATPTPAQLSSERRERLLAHFKNPTPQPAKPAPIVNAPRRNWSWVVPLGAAAAVVVILAGLLFPAMSGVQQRASRRAESSRTLADSATNTVIGQIRGEDEIRAGAEIKSPWASQPGQLRTFDNSGQASRPFQNYGVSSEPVPDLHSISLAPADKSKATALYLPPTTDAPAGGEPAGEPQAIPLAGLGRSSAAAPGRGTHATESEVEALKKGDWARLPDDRAAAGGFIYFPGDSTSKPADSAPPVAGFDGSVNFGSALATNPPVPTAPMKKPAEPITIVRESDYRSPIDPPQKPAAQSGKDARDTGKLADFSADGDKQRAVSATGVEIAQNNLKDQKTIGSGSDFFWADDETTKFNLDTKSEGTLWDEAGGKRRPASKVEGEKVQQLARAELREEKKELAELAKSVAEPFGEADERRDLKRAPEPAPLATKPPPPPAPEPALPEQPAVEMKKELEKIESAKQPRKPEVLYKTIDEAVLEGRGEKNGRQDGKAVPQAAADAAQRKLVEAQGYLESDRLDLAFKRAEEVLNIDPYNDEARRLEDRINKAKQDFDSNSYNETRARALPKVEKAWANPVRKLDVPSATPAPTKAEASHEREIAEQRSRVSALKQQEEVLAKLKPEELPQALRSAGIEDPTAARVARAAQVIGELSVEEKRLLNSGMGDDHPSVKGVREKLATYRSELESTMKVQRSEFANRSALEAKKLAAIEAKQPKELSKKLEEETPTARPAQPAAIPQPEVATSANAFSTFSLNVSDVAFKLAGASLEKGRMPELATVRSEEFINAFDYRDPEPAAGAPLAFATERARYPFAQNRDLVRFSVKTAAAGRQPGRPLNLVLLLDNSGSMERADRVRILREALRVLAAQLQPQDRLSVVAFARTPRLWADGVTGDKAGEAVARVGEITPQGGTNLDAALDLGYATALKHYQPGSISRVVLLTDGAANLGDVNPDALKRKVETNRQRGVALDCFGIGWEGYDDTLLETLARNGDGRYGFINTPEEAASGFAAQLAGALRVAASDVKVQVEWNPRRVTAYRQIGYAKHQLKKEQFRDNTVDAAEIGAAESGNALYVVEVNPRGEGDLATVRVRFKVPGTADYKEHEWAVPFTKDAPSLEQASPALRLAGTASAFSEWLVASPYAAEVTTDRLLGLLNGVPGHYPADPRPKKLEWMIRTAKSVSGR